MADGEWLTGLTGAATGAGTGALAGGAVGAGIGAAVGLGSGVLGGIGARRRRSAEQRALRAYQQALEAYGGQMGAISGEAFQRGRGLEQTYQTGFSDFLAKYPDLARALTANAAAEQGAVQGAAEAAWQPIAAQGGEGALEQNLRAEAQQQALAAYSPAMLANALGATDTGERGQRYQVQRLGSQRQRGAGQLAELTALRQALAYEPLAQAQARLPLALQRAQSAGSGYTLAGGLLGAGGSLAAGLAMARRPGQSRVPAGTTPGYVPVSARPDALGNMIS